MYECTYIMYILVHVSVWVYVWREHAHTNLVLPRGVVAAHGGGRAAALLAQLYHTEEAEGVAVGGEPQTAGRVDL